MTAERAGDGPGWLRGAGRIGPLPPAVGVLAALAVAATLAVVVACAPGGTAPPGGPGDRWQVGPTGPAPTITPNPSFPPIGGMITTGVRIDGKELVLALGRISGLVGMEAHLYDSVTGVVTPGPEATMGWSPPREPATGFADIREAALDTSHVLQWGWVRGPAARLNVRQDGADHPVTAATWSADPDVTAFWVLRRGRPAGNWLDESSPPPDDQLPVFTAYDRAGRELDRVLFKLIRPSPPFV
ncbi:MAG TPA: hypothetical protein VFR67_07310 [Pilimelia sp.]|nr:hypothetical protein [Pilimelia sp.]